MCGCMEVGECVRACRMVHGGWCVEIGACVLYVCICIVQLVHANPHVTWCMEVGECVCARRLVNVCVHGGW